MWAVTITCPTTEAQFAHLASKFPRGYVAYMYACEQCWEVARLPKGVYAIHVPDFYCFD